VLLDARASADDVLAGAGNLLGRARATWLIPRWPGYPRGATALEAAGHRLFDPFTYRPLPDVSGRHTAGISSPAGSGGCLAVPSRSPRTMKSRWRKPPSMHTLIELPMHAEAPGGAREVSSGYMFLPAGRWLLTVSVNVTSRRAVRSFVFDSEGRRVSTGTCAGVRGETQAHVHALSHAAGGAFRVAARVSSVDGRCHGASVLVEEVLFS
jgi:hypothetical protein